MLLASAGGNVHYRNGVGYAGSQSADLTVGGQPAPLQHRSYLWLPLYSGLEPLLVLVLSTTVSATGDGRTINTVLIIIIIIIIIIRPMCFF